MEESITISMDRYLELKNIESKLPELIENAINEYKSNTLKRLHEKDKECPELVRLRAKRYADKNRDKINEKRREKRKLEKNIKVENIKEITTTKTSTKDTFIKFPKGITLSF